ncbi:hypothetical protein NECAME_02035 [Necator americanus]|uniref:U6 small nuclear RNA (adenine-(43)-N(6))-methyltransferase n=1 Tax=Necator americanus TaxID=51031 RepID=W2TKK9_NECAM|nr:hypothetical protein NECAME_02035 [Necator americanus]ETN82298.1 hypothetical protein NECAME_02035 [Necator americanus]
MSLNRYMHPRNPYKDKPPDFNDLATRFADFRAHCTLGNNGKVFVNFQEDGAVRSLAKALLKKDFDLEVELPHGCLVPRVPQRLNYILFVEDLLELNHIKKDIVGIDIGTGASCVYALLGARWAGWRFVATEADKTAAMAAFNNVARNGLSQLVKVVHVSEHSSSLIKDLARQFSDLQFSFCMCNPPFFQSCETDKRFSVDTTSGSLLNECTTDSEEAERAPPRSATLARRGELEVEGGEVAFVGRLIDDSVLLQTQVSIYTTMLGKKSSITALSRRLSRIDGVRFTVSTLSQGRTQRWVLAWTFLPHIQLEDKNCSSLFLQCPNTCKGSPLKWIRSHLEGLGIDTERENPDMLICSARTVTWTNQRAKRRAEARLMHPSPKRSRMSSVDATAQVSMGVGDGRDSLSDAGNFDFCASFYLSEKQVDVSIQAFFPCSIRPSILRFRVIQSRENSGASFEFIDGYKPGLYQLLQYLRNQMR